MAHSKHLNIGVYIPTGCQLLDMSGIDLFSMLTPEYLTICNLPAPLIALAIPSTISYISLPSSGTHVNLTANVSLKITHTILDAEVQPGKLDILLVPGPDPNEVFGDEVMEFVRGHYGFVHEGGRRTDILSVCTAASLLAQSGILEGKKASGPRALVGGFRKKFPGVKWVDNRRWVNDGNLWMSGGITNGQEMIAAYLRDKFTSPTTEAVIAMADVGEKGVVYTTSNVRENGWWLWQILKAVWFGIGKEKRV